LPCDHGAVVGGLGAFTLLAMRRGCWLALALPSLCDAHGGAERLAPVLWSSWTFEPWVVVALLLSLALYAIGAVRLWRRAGAGRGLSRTQVAAFCGGWLALAAALVSPLDALSDRLFSAHMVQHEILMLVAAPLLVLGRPLAAFAWALPQQALRQLSAPWRSGWAAQGWRALTDPLSAWVLHALALWAWHIPSVFDAAIESPPLHALQHASFLGSALLFWWAALGSGSRPGRRGVALALLFTTMLHTGALGALLALAPTPWYPHYALAAGAGLDPLEDQQLGGLVMWVPGGLAYLAAGLVVAYHWLAGNPRPVPQR
jgi:putative membrane protein